MSTFGTYILRQTMGPLIATVAIALLVLLTERMLRLLDMVLDTHGGLTVLLQMLAFLVPHYMALALPVAFFLGVLLAFGRLHHNRELDALGSAGIGLRQLVSPVLILALILTALSALNFAVGQPYARYIYRALVHDVVEAAANVYLQERTFMEVKGVTFMAERIRRNSQEFAGVFIYEVDDSGKAIAMTARRGNLNAAPKGEPSTLFLVDGVRLEMPAADALATEGKARGSFGVLHFDQFQIPIGYNQLLSVGKSLVSFSAISPLIGQWLPFAVLALGSSYLFYRSAYKVPHGAGPWALVGALENLLPGPRAGGRLKRQHPE